MVGTTLRERLWGPTLPAGTTARASARLAACAKNPDMSHGSRAGKCLLTALDPHPPVHVFAFSA